MTGVRTFHDYDHLSKVTTITTSTDVQPIHCKCAIWGDSSININSYVL